MRSKIIKIFEASKGFKPLVRPKDAIDVKEPTVATDLHSNKQVSHAPIEKQEKFVVKKNKFGEFVLAKFENNVEIGSHAFKNIKDLKVILHQDLFKNFVIDYRVSNDEEEFLKSTGQPKTPEEAPLNLNFGTSYLLNQRDSGTKTYITPQEKNGAITVVTRNVKDKLANKKAMVKEIKELKNSNIVDNVATEFMNGNVFIEGDEFTNIVRYVHYLVYDALTNYFLVNEDTKILRTQSDIRKRGGNISPIIKELAREILPSFERYLNRKEKSELFIAFQEAT
jgi:hypothetical protein